MRLLLLRHTDGAATAAGRLCVLTAHAEAPVVTETTVSADLLKALEILTELRVEAVSEELRVLAINNVLKKSKSVSKCVPKSHL